MTAIITGADGGIGYEITRAIARAGYSVIMACHNPRTETTKKKQKLIRETGNQSIDVMHLDLSSFESIRDFSCAVRKRNNKIKLLMNNAGTITPKRVILENGLEKTVCVNCIGPHLLTRNLINAMDNGGRIVNMGSLMHFFGRIDLPEFFSAGGKGCYNRLKSYSNSKLGLVLNSLEVAERYKSKKITCNISDPGVVSTGIITMNNIVIDTLANLFFRPLIRTPAQGAKTSIKLLLDSSVEGNTGMYFANCRSKNVSKKVTNHPLRKMLYERTEEIIRPYLID